MTTDSSPLRRVSYDLKAGRVAGLAWGDASRPVEILFLHAAGFNARTYRTLLAPLGDRFHVVAVDLRGHGLTELPARTFGYGSWNRHRDDVAELIESGLGAPATIAGHSMGAVVGLLVGGKRPDLVRGLAMIEPVLMGPAAYSFSQLPGAPLLWGLTAPMSRGASRRRARFSTREEALEAFKSRGVFQSFTDEQLGDYLGDGLKETEQGLQLACAPAYESRSYTAQRHDPWAALVRAPPPIVVLKGDKRSTLSKGSAERLAAFRPDMRIATVEGASHMLPFERPDRARAAMETAAVMARSGYRDIV